MKSSNQNKSNLPESGSLSNILASIGLIAAAIEARICRACRWNDDDFEHFSHHTNEIPEKKKVLINSIISSELLKRFVSAPAIPVKEPVAPGEPLKDAKPKKKRLTNPQTSPLNHRLPIPTPHYHSSTRNGIAPRFP